MFTKAWTYVTDKIFRKDQPQPIVILPFTRRQAPPVRQPPKLLFSLSQIPQQKDITTEFKIVVEGENQFRKGLVPTEEGEIAQGVIDEVRQLEEQLKKLSIQERRLEEAQRNTSVLDPDRYLKISKQLQIQRQTSDLHEQYQTQIIQFRQCKYSKEKSDFPLIPFESFQRILVFWRDKKRSNLEIKKTKLQSVEKLTFKAMGGIDHGEWLNDDVINMTIQLMEKKLPQDGVKLLNSFFATTVLPKAENMINRYLKKKAIDRNLALIMPVNDRNHWYFAKLDPKTLTLTIFDSLRKRPETYLDNPIFKNALKFAKWLYGADITLIVSDNYPQQNNGYDCGVFMLMGIRDALRNREWSFRQGDMRFKRIQLACQVYDEELMLENQDG